MQKRPQHKLIKSLGRLDDQQNKQFQLVLASFRKNTPVFR